MAAFQSRMPSLILTTSKRISAVYASMSLTCQPVYLSDLTRNVSLRRWCPIILILSLFAQSGKSEGLNIENINCPFCKTEKVSKFFHDKRRDYMRCHVCSLVFVPPWQFVSSEE